MRALGPDRGELRDGRRAARGRAARTRALRRCRAARGHGNSGVEWDPARAHPRDHRVLGLPRQRGPAVRMLRRSGPAPRAAAAHAPRVPARVRGRTPAGSLTRTAAPARDEPRRHRRITAFPRRPGVRAGGPAADGRGVRGAVPTRTGRVRGAAPHRARGGGDRPRRDGRLGGDAGIPGAHARGGRGAHCGEAERPAALRRTGALSRWPLHGLRDRRRRAVCGRAHPQVETDRERDRPAHRIRARPDRRALPLGGAGAHRTAHRVPARRAACAGSLQTAPPRRMARAALRRGVRLGELRAGGSPDGSRGARLDDRPPDPRGEERSEEVAPLSGARDRRARARASRCPPGRCHPPRAAASRRRWACH